MNQITFTLNKCFLCCILYLISFHVFSQQKKSNIIREGHLNNVFIEGIGNTETMVSANYERIFLSSKKENIHLAFRTGFGWNKPGFAHATQYRFATEINGLFGGGNKILELGLGYNPTFNDLDLNAKSIPDEENGKYLYNYSIRLGLKVIIENAFLRFSYLFTYKPITPQSSTLIYRGFPGFSAGVYF